MINYDEFIYCRHIGSSRGSNLDVLTVRSSYKFFFIFKTSCEYFNSCIDINK